MIALKHEAHITFSSDARLFHWKTKTVLDTTLCDKVCQWLATVQCFSPSTPVSSTNKTDHHDITEILLKVVLNTINLKNPKCWQPVSGYM